MNPVSGDRVKQARQIRGLTRERVADLIHQTPQQLTRYESDLDEPSVETLERIAIVTSFPIAFFRQPPGPQFPLGSLLFHYDFQPNEYD